MCDYDNAIFRLATAQEAEPEDYIGEDGLLYCGSCRQPKEAYFPEGKTLFGRDRHPKECDSDASTIIKVSSPIKEASRNAYSTSFSSPLSYGGSIKMQPKGSCP